jgi:hypothetical protein
MAEKSLVLAERESCKLERNYLILGAILHRGSSFLHIILRICSPCSFKRHTGNKYVFGEIPFALLQEDQTSRQKEFIA